MGGDREVGDGHVLAYRDATAPGRRDEAIPKGSLHPGRSKVPRNDARRLDSLLDQLVRVGGLPFLDIRLDIGGREVVGRIGEGIV
jgi:hypothetical protein